MYQLDAFRNNNEIGNESGNKQFGFDFTLNFNQNQMEDKLNYN